MLRIAFSIQTSTRLSPSFLLSVRRALICDDWRVCELTHVSCFVPESHQCTIGYIRSSLHPHTTLNSLVQTPECRKWVIFSYIHHLRCTIRFWYSFFIFLVLQHTQYTLIKDRSFNMGFFKWIKYMKMRCRTRQWSSSLDYNSFKVTHTGTLISLY